MVEEAGRGVAGKEVEGEWGRKWVVVEGWQREIREVEIEEIERGIGGGVAAVALIEGRKGWTRRQFLQALLIAGGMVAAGGVLSACRGGEATPTVEPEEVMRDLEWVMVEDGEWEELEEGKKVVLLLRGKMPREWIRRFAEGKVREFALGVAKEVVEWRGLFCEQMGLSREAVGRDQIRVFATKEELREALREWGYADPLIEEKLERTSALTIYSREEPPQLFWRLDDEIRWAERLRSKGEWGTLDAVAALILGDFVHELGHVVAVVVRFPPQVERTPTEEERAKRIEGWLQKGRKWLERFLEEEGLEEKEWWRQEREKLEKMVGVEGFAGLTLFILPSYGERFLYWAEEALVEWLTREVLARVVWENKEEEDRVESVGGARRWVEAKLGKIPSVLAWLFDDFLEGMKGVEEEGIGMEMVRNEVLGWRKVGFEEIVVKLASWSGMDEGRVMVALEVLAEAVWSFVNDRDLLEKGGIAGAMRRAEELGEQIKSRIERLKRMKEE